MAANQYLKPMLDVGSPRVFNCNELTGRILAKDENAPRFFRNKQLNGVVLISCINELVDEVLGFARSDARLSEVQIVTEFDIGIPRFSLDRVQIQQVLLNLIRNAIESLAANPRDQRIVHVRTSHDDKRTLRIEVADNGPGVPDELVARIFDPFCTTKETGTGLGLAISRTIVAAHHGKLSHRVIPTGGASFTVELPSLQGGGE